MNETNGSLRDRVSRIEGGYEHLATKADIAETKAELKADIAEVRTELKAEISDVRSELKADVADVKADLAEVKTDLAQFKVQIDEHIARLEARLLLRFGSIAVAAAVGFSQLLG